MKDQIKQIAKETALQRVRNLLLVINALGGVVLITLIVSRMGSATSEQSLVSEMAKPIEESVFSSVPEEDTSLVDETTNPIEQSVDSPILEEDMGPEDEATKPIEESATSPVPEEWIDIWFADFGQDYTEFEYVYCDIDMDGTKDILIQSQNNGEVVVDIYILNRDPWAEEYYYSQANSLAHMGDWQWYSVEAEGLYAVVLYEGWQYIYQVTKYDSYVETAYISYGPLHGEPAVYENPLYFTKY